MLVPDAGLEGDLLAVQCGRNGDGGHQAGKTGDRAAFVGGGAVVPAAPGRDSPELDAGLLAIGPGSQPGVGGPLVRALEDGGRDAVEVDRDDRCGAATTGVKICIRTRVRIPTLRGHVRDSANPRASPGGSPEPYDADLYATLAREAFEENTVRIGPSAAYLGYQEVRQPGGRPSCSF